MEQAILDFIRENPQEFIASDEEDEDLCAATGERQSPRITGDKLLGHQLGQTVDESQNRIWIHERRQRIPTKVASTESSCQPYC